MSNDIFMGEMDKANQPHGRGVKVSKQGGLYEGHFKHGERHGRGRLIYPGGQVFEGSFKDGEKHGQGRITYPNILSEGIESGSYRD